MNEKITQYANNALDSTVAFAPKILIGLLILWVGWKFSSILANMIKRVLEKKKVDASLIPFLCTLTAALLKVAVTIAVIDYMGVKTTSFVAILGAAGLAIGLALSGTLQNFAGGVVLLIFRPFSVGDRISALDYDGVVKEIQIFQTLILTADNKSVFLPNGALSSGAITNYNIEGDVRVEAKIGISYDSDIDQARAIILETIKSDERLVKEKEPVVAVSELADSSVNLSIFVWTHTDNYWGVLFETQESVKKAFDAAGIKIPYPQRELYLHQK